MCFRFKVITRFCVFAVIILLGSGCVAGHKQFKSKVVTDLSGCSDLNSAYMIVNVDCGRMKVIDNGGARNAFNVVELDDFGEFYDSRQVTDVVNQIKLASTDGATVLITYIHGWRHNASESSSNLRDFRRLVFELASNPCALNGTNTAGNDSEECNYKNVIGLYVGWRGDAWHLKASSQNRISWYLQSLTFWNRLAASKEVAGTNITKFLLKISDTLRSGDRERLSDSCLYIDFDQKTERCSKNVVIGHSMGGRVLEQTVAQAFLGGRHIAEGADVNGLVKRNVAELESFNDIKSSLEAQLIEIGNLVRASELEKGNFAAKVAEHELAVKKRKATVADLRDLEKQNVPIDESYSAALSRNSAALKSHLRTQVDSKWQVFEQYLCSLDRNISGAFNSSINIQESNTVLSEAARCPKVPLSRDSISIALPITFGDNICQLIDSFAEIFNEASLDKNYSTFRLSEAGKCNIPDIVSQRQIYRSEIDALRNSIYAANINGFYINVRKSLEGLRDNLSAIVGQIVMTADFKEVELIGVQDGLNSFLETIENPSIDQHTLEYELLVSNADNAGFSISKEVLTLDSAREHFLQQTRAANRASLKQADFLATIQIEQEIINNEKLKVSEAKRKLDIIVIKIATALKAEQLLKSQLESSKLKFLDLSAETELLFESVTRPPFDLALMINPATSAMSSRMLKNAMCDSRLIVEDLGFMDYKRPPWLVSVSSTDDLATSKTFLFASKLENMLRLFKAPRNKLKGARVGPFSDCVGELLNIDQVTLDKQPAPFISEFQTHEVVILNPDLNVVQTCDYVPRHLVGVDSNISLGIEDGAKIAFDKTLGDTSCVYNENYLGSFKGSDYSLEDLRKNKKLAGDDYWMFTVPPQIIPDHNKIFTYEVGLLTSALLNHSESHGLYCMKSQSNKGLCRILKTKQVIYAGDGAH